VLGHPNHDEISATLAERASLSIRMELSRYARLTNAHARGLANRVHWFAVCMAYHNFCRPREALQDKDFGPCIRPDGLQMGRG